MKFSMARSKFAFIDANIWIAELDTDDTTHQKARALLIEALKERTVLVSVFVIQEVCSIFMKKGYMDLAKFFYEFVTKHGAVKVVSVGQEWLDATSDLLAEITPRKALSYTDYSLMAIARELGAEIITFDEKLLSTYRQLTSNR